MTNPFLDDKAQAGSNPFLGIEDGIEPTRPGPAVISAQQNEPDAWATAKRKGAVLGLAPEIVSRNPAEVRKLELQQSLDQVRKTNPALADWLVRDDNLTLAQDDTESLGFIGRALEYPTEIASGFNRFVGAGISGLGDINDAVANRATAGLRAVGLGKVAGALEAPILPAWANPSRIARGVGDTIVEQTVYETPEERRNMGHDVAQGLGSLVGQVVATYVNPAAAVTLTAGQGAEQQATRAEGEGATEADKSNAVLIGATITAATEKMGLDILLERLPPAIKNKAAQWVADKILAAGAEGAQEGLEQVAHNAVAQLTYAPDSPLLEGVGDNATLGALVGGLARTVLTPGYRYHERRQQGQSENQQVDALSKMVQQSKLFERDPQKLADYIAGAKQAGASNVYLPAEDVTTLFQSAPEAAAAFEAAGVSRESILETTALNSDLAIPLETYLTKIAPEYHAQLGKAARLSPDAITDADVDVNDEQDAAVERFLASVNDAQAEGQADMRVYNDVLGQLLGRYQQADAEQMASVVNAFFRDGLGARAGIDPMELYGRYGLRIVEHVERRVMGRVDPEVDSMIERLRAGDIPTDDQAYGPTLAEFLSGPGIRSAKNEPMSGEIRTLAENDRATRKGRQRLVREEDANALTLDYAREAAVEAGYLSPDATLDDLLAALNDGGRAEVNRDGKMSGLRDALTEMDREISRLGLDVSKASNEEIRRALFGRGTTELDQSGKAKPAEPRRGFIQFGKDRQFTIGLTQARDMSTFLHEFGHFALEVMGDVAADAEANPEIAADYAILLDWLGVKSRSEIGVEQHEKMARGFEKYLGEGAPPTPELAGAFARFRSWMKAIYKSLTSLNVELNPEVRGVMSRMLAGDAAIQQAEQATVAEPLFKEAARAGWTEQQFAAYLELQARAHDEAETRIMSEAYNEVMRERKKWWREESNRIETEVRAEFEAMPVYRAWASLARNTEPNGTPLDTPPVKLSADWLRERYGQEFMNKNLLRRQVYAADGGVHGDVIAPVFGFDNGAALVEALANATPLSKAIRAETQARMRERHGDMRNDGTLPEKAMRAVHNTRRMKVIEAEIAALARLAGEPAMTTAQARKWAQERIAVKRVREITPYQYLRAERKAAREALRAANAGKPVEALAAARRKLANAVMYDEASKARDGVEKAKKRVKQLAKKSAQERLALARGDWRDITNSILDAVGGRQLGPKSSRIELARWVERHIADGHENPIPDSIIELVDSGARTAIDNMTVGQVSDLRAALRNISKQVGNENNVILNGKRVDWSEQKDRVIAALDIAMGEGKAFFSEEELSAIEQIKRAGGSVADGLLPIQTIIERLDGGATGPFHDLLWNIGSDAASARADMRREVLRPVVKLVESWSKSDRKKMIEPIKIDSLGGVAMLRHQLIGAALHMGTPSSLRVMMEGGRWINGKHHKFTPEVIDEIKSKLTREDWALVEQVWGIVGTRLWDETVALQKRVGGIVPDRLETHDVDTPFGTIKGGYFPLVAARGQSNVGVKQEAGEAIGAATAGIGRATTSKSRLKERTGATYPVEMNLETLLMAGIDRVVTDVTHREFVLQANKILTDPQISSVIRDRGNVAMLESVRGAVGASVNQVAGNDPAMRHADKIMNAAITNLTSMALGLRVALGLANYASAWPQAAARIGSKRLAMEFFNAFGPGRFGQVEATVNTLSPYMRNRQEEFESTYRDAMATLSGRQTMRKKMIRFSLAYITYVDRLSCVPIWMAAYKQAVAGQGQAFDMQAAVRAADKAVQSTQTDGRAIAQSAFERDGKWRMFKLFIGPMLIQGARIRDSAAKRGVSRNMTYPERMGVMLAAWVIPAIIFDLAVGRLPEDDDDDDDEVGLDDWAKWAGVKIAMYPLMTVPLIRDGAAALEAKILGKPVFSKNNPMSDAAVLFADVGYRTTDAAMDALDEDEEVDADKLVKAYTRALGAGTGLPVVAGNTAGDFIYDVGTGEYDPQSPLDIRYLFVRRPDDKK